MFTLQIDQSNIIDMLNDVQLRQLPWATKQALSKTANLAQTAQRNHMADTMHIRRPWVLRAIKIDRTDLSKTSWNVIIYVQPEFLEVANRLETGEDHLPKFGAHFCIPNEEVFNYKIISADNPLHPANIHLTQVGQRWESTDGSGIFMIHSKATDTPLIMQRTDRTGKGVAQPLRAGIRYERGAKNSMGQYTRGKAIRGRRPGGTRILYTLVTKSRVPIKLKFYETITNSVNDNWQNQMENELIKALQSAR